MASIICGHCGAIHETVQEVRECAVGNPIPEGVDLGRIPVKIFDGTAYAVARQRQSVQETADEINRSFADTPFKPREEIREGFYTMDGSVFKIVLSQTGNLYAKKLQFTHDEPVWVFEKGIMRMIERSAKRLSAEEAGKYGRISGICIICGQRLTNEESIERGIGPVCAGKL